MVAPTVRYAPGCARWRPWSPREVAGIVEGGETSFGARVPDPPECVAVAATQAEALRLIRGAVASHLEGLREQRSPLAAPSTVAFVDVAA